MFLAVLLILCGLTGLGICGVLLMFSISEAMREMDAETWHR